MLLFLSGGGNIKDSRDLDKRFISSLSDNSFVYIPVAMEDNPKHTYPDCFDWINHAFTSLSKKSLAITMLTELNDVQSKFLNSQAGIYIGGGNTYKLMDKLQKSEFAKILLDYINSGKPVYGGSAGAIIMGESIATVKEENTINSTQNNGLNLLKGFSLKCHFTNSRSELEAIYEFNRKNEGGVLALSEQSGLIVSEDCIEAVGKKPVHIISDRPNPFSKSVGTFIQTKSS